MAIQCKICFESYSAPGTRHAPYSTSCGHVMGKECLEKLKECSNDDDFNCPFCSGNIKFNDCHPIYGIVEEFKDIDEESKSIIRELKKDKNFSFLKDFNKHINGNIHFFDEHKGYILIAGEASSMFTRTQFIKLIVTKEKQIFNISTSIPNSKRSCLCFNKNKNDAIEFCIGYIDGTIKLYRCKFDGYNLKIISKNILNNLDFISHLRGRMEVNSICFLNDDTVAFSIGKGKLRIWNKKEEWLSKTKIFIKFPYSESDKITHLKSIKFNECIGVMNNRIYVFPESATSYELASEIGRTIVSYSIDEDFNRLLVLYSNEMDGKRKNSTSQSFVLYKIIEEDYTDNFGKELKKYYAINLMINHNIERNIPNSFTPRFFSVKQSDKTLLYHGILPNTKYDQLEIISLNKQIKSEGYEDFKNIKNCLGITFVDEEEFCIQRNTRKKIAIIFKNKVVVMDIF
uniref:RING-type domain-containing protein n=1 Tax=Strongyloides papillosus TaxID=174720 RepID=A0A0N5C2F8_STREA